MIEAVDLTAAISHLKQMGLFPLEVVPLESAQRRSEAAVAGRPLSRMELSLWARTLSQGLAAGMSLTQAMHLLAEQEKGRAPGIAAAKLEAQVTGGMNLAQAMSALQNVFPPVAVAIVKAGEASGALEQVLQGLAFQAESEAELIAKVRGALIYPLFVLAVGVGTVSVLVWVVVPKLMLLFEETGQPLPLATRILIGAGRWLGFAAVGGAAAATAGAWMSRRGKWKFPAGQWIVRALRVVPWFGKLIQQAEIARLSATLGLLLEHGLPLPESLNLASGTAGQPELRDQIRRVQREVMEGMPVSGALKRAGIREPFLLTMIAMGEAQGDLARAFLQASGRYREEVDRTVRVLSTLIEPVMILVVGVVVGGIVFSMLMPIFQINFTVR